MSTNFAKYLFIGLFFLVNYAYSATKFFAEEVGFNIIAKRSFCSPRHFIPQIIDFKEYNTFFLNKRNYRSTSFLEKKHVDNPSTRLDKQRTSIVSSTSIQQDGHDVRVMKLPREAIKRWKHEQNNVRIEDGFSYMTWSSKNLSNYVQDEYNNSIDLYNLEYVYSSQKHISHKFERFIRFDQVLDNKEQLSGVNEFVKVFIETPDNKIITVEDEKLYKFHPASKIRVIRPGATVIEKDRAFYRDVDIFEKSTVKIENGEVFEKEILVDRHQEKLVVRHYNFNDLSWANGFSLQIVSLYLADNQSNGAIAIQQSIIKIPHSPIEEKYENSADSDKEHVSKRHIYYGYSGRHNPLLYDNENFQLKEKYQYSVPTTDKIEHKKTEVLVSKSGLFEKYRQLLFGDRLKTVYKRPDGTFYE